MNQVQRIAQQRMLVRQALGSLHAVSELFGVEDNARDSMEHLRAWRSAVAEFEEWVFGEGPIA